MFVVPLRSQDATPLAQLGRPVTPVAENRKATRKTRTSNTRRWPRRRPTPQPQV